MTVAGLVVLLAGISGAYLQYSSDWPFAHQAEPEGYRVLSYDSESHQWAILRNGTFDGKYLRKRITVLCNSFKMGDLEAVTGPDVCHLQVGRMIISNRFPPEEKRQDFVDIHEMPGGVLTLTEGYGADRVMQQFKILKYEVLAESHK